MRKYDICPIPFQTVTDITNPTPVVIVDTVSQASKRENIYDEINSVVYGVPTAVLTYTVPVGMNFTMTGAFVSGTNIGDYIVYVNGIKQARQYTMYTGLTAEFIFPNNLVVAGDIIKIEVTNPQTYVGDYSAQLFGAFI